MQDGLQEVPLSGVLTVKQFQELKIEGAKKRVFFLFKVPASSSSSHTDLSEGKKFENFISKLKSSCNIYNLMIYTKSTDKSEENKTFRSKSSISSPLMY